MIELFTSRCNPHAQRFSVFGCGKRRGVPVAALLSPPLVAGRQYLKSGAAWYLLDLQLDNGVNTTHVDQTPVASPGPQYRGYVVMVCSDDGTKHRLSLNNDGGTITPWVYQDAIIADAFFSRSLVSTDAEEYLVTVVLDGGAYTLSPEQP